MYERLDDYGKHNKVAKQYINFSVYIYLSLLITADRFMNQRCKGQGMIFSIITANKEKTFVQRLVKSIYWLLLKREKIPT